MSSQRLIILGGSGFVGSNLVENIRSKYSIISLSSSQADLTNPGTLEDKFLSGDIIINAAGYSKSSDLSEAGKQKFYSVNVNGVKNLVHAAISAGARQLIHISSVAAMGIWSGMQIKENMYKKLESPYAESKLAGEMILRQYNDKLPITILRPTLVFGKGKGLTHFLCNIIAKGVVPLPQNGSAYIPLTYVGNIAKAVELAVDNPECFGGTFVIGDEQSYRLRDIVLLIARFLGEKPLILPVPMWIAKPGVSAVEYIARVFGTVPVFNKSRLELLTNSTQYDITLFRKATGYNSPYTLEKALDIIVKDYMRHR